MIGLTNIERITVSKTVLLKAFDFLRYAGNKGVEAVALFAGSENDKTFQIKEVIRPKQMGYILEQGLMYAVDGDELHRINVWLYENKMKLIAQIHSHPTEAYHSAADDRFPIVDTIGGISIVVPNFASGELLLKDCAIYRLSLNKTWDELSTSEIDSLFQIV
ncbi:MAG: Mov34/MPN/PAD-1 family protein [Porphyromonadaceae bacterium]|nr:Mov34/MPN/PAD-1 family protein [Porphyromonadaceae bacterium]